MAGNCGTGGTKASDEILFPRPKNTTARKEGIPSGGVPTIKVLFVASELYPEKLGGVQTVVFQLVKNLALRVGLELLAIKPTRRETTELYKGHVRLRQLPSFGRGPWKYPLRNLAYAGVAILSSRTDIVHYHILPGANCFLLPLLFRSFKSVKQVVSIYDWIPMEMRYYDLRDRIEHLLHWSLVLPNLRLMDRYVVNSTYMEEVLKGAGFSRLSVIPNGIDLQEWLGCKRMRLAGELNIAFWGKLSPKKGVMDLITAFARIAQRFPAAHLHIIGRGPYEKRCRKLAEETGFPERIHFLGEVDGKTLKDVASSCDICVFPSEYEGFGISILEAMAMGKPVVTTNRGGQVDFAVDEENALLYEPGDVVQLASCLTRLLESEELRGRLGEEARKTAMRYDWSHISRRYIELYEELRAER